MKKMTKKLGAVVLALAMCFSLCCVAFADDGDPEETQYTITIDPAYSEETYTAYKIFDVTYKAGDTEGNNVSYAYTIDSDSAWYSTVSESGLFTLTQINDSTTYNVAIKDGVTSEKIAEKFTTVPEGAVAAATATAETVVNEETGETGTTTVTLVVTDSGPGYYFVTTTLGSVVSIDTTSPSVTIEDKNPVPTLTKVVTNESHTGTYENGTTGEGDEDTAKVGDILEFEISISNAAHKSALCLHDYTTQGLTYYGSDHINVYLNSVSASNLVASANYTIQDSDCGDGCDFEIVFSPAWLDDLSDTAVIIITYEAVVNEAAVMINDNDAFLTYGTAGRSVTVETKTDVYGLSLKKVDGNGNELEGATFTLAYGDSFGTTLSGILVDFYFNGTTYTVHDTIDQEYAGEETTTEILVGSATIFGLDAGTYTLTETEAPDGYNKLTSAITVTVSDTGVVSISGVDSTVATATDGTITVVNNEGAILPGTGGMGTTIFYIIGGVLVVGAVVVLVTRRRMTRED